MTLVNGAPVGTWLVTVNKKGSTVTFEDNAADRRVLAAMKSRQGRGTAALQSPSGSICCTITDRDKKNNTCACAPLTDFASQRAVPLFGGYITIPLTYKSFAEIYNN